MTEQMKKVELDDSDDVIIIGDVIPKPMIARETKQKCRHVKFSKSKYKRESLTITQKVKVKKRHRYVLKDAQVNGMSKKTDLKDRELSIEEVKAPEKCKRFIPVCSRQNCMDNRWRYEKNGRKRIEKTKTASKLDRDFPRDLERMLSPISPMPLGSETSLDEISLDISSLEEHKESKLETLIKRTRDRDRIDQMSKKRRLTTPPRTSKANEDMTEDKQMCIDTTGCKPPHTSTPKYEENDNNNKPIASNNNILAQEKSCNSVSLEDIQIMLSPIKKIVEPICVLDINCQQNTENNINISNKNVKQLNKDLQIEIKQSEGAVTSHTNYEHNIADNKVQISKNNYIDKKQENEKSILMQTVSNSNSKQNVKDTNMAIINNNKQLNKNQVINTFIDSESIKTVCNTNKNIAPSTMSISDLNKSQSNTEQNHSETKKSEYIESDITYTSEQNITDGNMHFSNLNIGQSKIDHDKHLNHSQNNKIEYIQTIVSNNRDHSIGSSMMHISDLNKDQLNTEHAMCNLNHPQNLNSEYIQTEASNTNYEQHIKENDTFIYNSCNFDELLRKNQVPLFAKRQTQQEDLDYIKSVINTDFVQNNDGRPVLTNNNNQKQSYNDWVHEEPQCVQNVVSDQKIDDTQMSFVYNNHNYQEQANTGTSPCGDNIKIEHNKSEPINAVVSNTKLEDMEISISCDSPVFEDTHSRYQKSEYIITANKNTNYEQNNSYSQEPISSLSSFIDDIPIQHKEYDKDNIYTHDSNKNYKQNIEDDMSISYNYLPEQRNSRDNPFSEYTHFQSEYYRHRSVSRSYYEQNNNFTEQRNRNHDFFEDEQDKKSDFICTNKQFDQNRYGNMSISYDDKEQQNRAHSPIFENVHSQQKKFDHTPNFNKKYEQTDINFSPFFEYTHVEHEKSDYIHKMYKKFKQIKDRKTTFFNNLDQQNKSYKDVHIQHKKTDYFRTAYSIRNILKRKTFNDNNFNEEPTRHPSPFFDDIHIQNKKRTSMYTDESKKSYEQNIGDRRAYFNNNNNFKQKPTGSQSNSTHRPFFSSIRRNTNMHTVSYNTYHDQKIERRKMSRNRDNVELFEDNYEHHRKSEYTAVFKKKVNVFVDKQMNDEAYEDVLVGLPLRDIGAHARQYKK